MAEEKVKDYLALEENDGTFFDRMHKMEREIFEERGDTEMLAYLDEEEKRRQEEYEAEEKLYDNTGKK